MQAGIFRQIQRIGIGDVIIIIAFSAKTIALGNRIVILLSLLCRLLSGDAPGLQISGLHMQIDESHLVLFGQIILILTKRDHDIKLSHRKNAYIDVLRPLLIKIFAVIFRAESITIAMLIREIPWIDLIIGDCHMQGIPLLHHFPIAALTGIVGMMARV